MKIQAIESFLVTLPFRFAFGHNLATRQNSTNIIVRVTLDDGTQGYGEGVPRDYVTGETSDDSKVESVYGPRLIGLDVSDLKEVVKALERVFVELDLDKRPQGASWCAVELAVLDAVARAHNTAVSSWFGPVRNERIRYGGVVPFGGKKALTAMLWAYKLYGFKTVKIKVGKTLEEDLAKVALSRKIMGPDTILRVDANCAWTLDQALKAAEAFAPYNVASYEQPVPPDQLEWLQKITAAIACDVLADESLCTIQQAQTLASERICSAFNIRISKVGGFIAASKMVEIANQHNIRCHLGAQVGESGILSAAARVFAAVNQPFENYEGSMNSFLLQKDLTSENLTVSPGGYGTLAYARKDKSGFGITISAGTLESWAQATNTADSKDSFSEKFLPSHSN